MNGTKVMMVMVVCDVEELKIVIMRAVIYSV